MAGKGQAGPQTLGCRRWRPPGAWAYRGGVPVKAVRAEVCHGRLVAVVSREWGFLRQQPLHLVIRPHEQGDNLSHRLLNDVPGL